MKWFFRFAFLMCAASCFAQAPVTVAVVQAPLCPVGTFSTTLAY